MPEIPKREALPQSNSEKVSHTEQERLIADIYRTDMEKFKLFVQMLRRNAMFKKAKVTHN